MKRIEWIQFIKDLATKSENYESALILRDVEKYIMGDGRHDYNPNDEFSIDFYYDILEKIKYYSDFGPHKFNNSFFLKINEESKPFVREDKINNILNGRTI